MTSVYAERVAGDRMVTSSEGKGGDPRALLVRHADLLLAGVVVAIVAMMIVPLPTPLLDLLLSVNIAAVVTLLLVSLYVGEALKARPSSRWWNVEQRVRLLARRRRGDRGRKSPLGARRARPRGPHAVHAMPQARRAHRAPCVARLSDGDSGFRRPAGPHCPFPWLASHSKNVPTREIS